MTARRRLLAPLALAIGLLACAKYPTAIYVRVTADPAVLARVNAVVVRVYDGASGGMMPVPFYTSSPTPIMRAATEQTFVVTDTGRFNSVRIEVEGYVGIAGSIPGNLLMPNNGIVTDRATVTWQQDKVLSVSLRLRETCMAPTRMPCPPTERCISATECVASTTNNAAPYLY